MMNRFTDPIDDKLDFYETLAALPLRQRRAALLLMDGYSPDEIGEKFNVSGRYVYVILKNLEIHFV